MVGIVTGASPFVLPFAVPLERVSDGKGVVFVGAVLITLLMSSGTCFGVTLSTYVNEGMRRTVVGRSGPYGPS